MRNDTAQDSSLLRKERAAEFVANWRDRSGKELDQIQEFYEDLFSIFDKVVHNHVVFEYRTENGRMDALWPGTLLVEQKKQDINVNKAYEQLFKYLPGMQDDIHPSHYLACNFREFILHDRILDKKYEFGISEFEEHLWLFDFIDNTNTTLSDFPIIANLHASNLIANLHEQLKSNNHDENELNWFVMRIIFCMFGDYTKLFEKDNMFFEFINSRKSHSKIGHELKAVLDHMSKPQNSRLQNNTDIHKFPYLNGGLFKQGNLTTYFTKDMIKSLQQACTFNWANVSPTILGSLYQSVMENKGDKRRQHGVHYTTEENILKVLEPLFLNDLNLEFENIMANHEVEGGGGELNELHHKLSSIKILDPACGCGNFLVVAYKHLRKIENKIIFELYKDEKEVDIKIHQKIDMNNFLGFDIQKISISLAKTSLWMMDHLMNIELGNLFKMHYKQLPLPNLANIMECDALDVEWSKLLPDDLSYIIGNPPFGGAKLQNSKQRKQIHQLTVTQNSGGTLDYVSGWFIKSAEFVKDKTTKVGFVTTSSICQGEQVAQLWDMLLTKVKIGFAYHPFEWKSDVKSGEAKVHVSIIGLYPTCSKLASTKIYRHKKTTEHMCISPYLIPGDKLINKRTVVKETSLALNNFPKSEMGTQPIDDGNYIFTTNEKLEFLKKEKDAEKYFKRYIGAREFNRNEERWILNLTKFRLNDLSAYPEIVKRIKAVSIFRRKSQRIQTRKLADTPTEFCLDVQPKDNYLLLPGVVSPANQYYPVGYMDNNTVPSNATLIVQSPDKALFGILSSSTHYLWLRYVGGKLGSSHRYSIGMVYNTFPLPKINKKILELLKIYGSNIIKERNKTDKTIYEQYLNYTMPDTLQDAHLALDQFVDKLYNFENHMKEEDKVVKLLNMYVEHNNGWLS